MKHKLINFDGIVNSLIVHNLLINYRNLSKESINTEAVAHSCSVAVLKNQKQTLAYVLRDGCPQKFCNIQRKTPVLESAFNKVAGLQLSCEYCEFFKNSFFIKHLQWLFLKNS